MANGILPNHRGAPSSPNVPAAAAKAASSSAAIASTERPAPPLDRSEAYATAPPKQGAGGVLGLIGQHVRLSAEDLSTIASFIARTPDAPLWELDRACAHALQSALPASLGRLARSSPHGTPNSFSLARLATATAEQVVLLERYLSPAFVDQAPAEKLTVIQGLAPLLRPGTESWLRFWHLPQVMQTSEGPVPITLALEAELILDHDQALSALELLDFYAPDASGKLDPTILTPELLAKDGVLTGTSKRVGFARLSHERKVACLRWRDLTLDGRYEYFKANEARHPRSPLARIDDVGQAPRGVVLPKTLQRTLAWDGPGVAEIATATSYQSIDQLDRDRSAIREIARSKKAHFHMHVVTDLPTAADIKKLGPGYVGLTVLTSLRAYTRGIRHGGALIGTRAVKPWTAREAIEATASMRSGELPFGDPQSAIMHKTHELGLRGGRRDKDSSSYWFYGAPSRVGTEVRGALGTLPMTPGSDDSEDAWQQVMAENLVTTLSRGSFADLTADTWEGWNLGDAQVIAQAESELPSRPSSVPLQEVFEEATKWYTTEHAYALASPLANWGALPGMTARHREVIAEARREYLRGLADIRDSMTYARQRGFEIDARSLYRHLDREGADFFARTRIDDILEGALREARNGVKPS